MNVYIVCGVAAVGFAWVATLMVGWMRRMRDRAEAAERFAQWMRQERTITSTLDEIRNLPETRVER